MIKRLWVKYVHNKSRDDKFEDQLLEDKGGNGNEEKKEDEEFLVDNTEEEKTLFFEGMLSQCVKPLFGQRFWQEPRKFSVYTSGLVEKERRKELKYRLSTVNGLAYTLDDNTVLKKVVAEDADMHRFVFEVHCTVFSSRNSIFAADITAAPRIMKYRFRAFNKASYHEWLYRIKHIMDNTWMAEQATAKFGQRLGFRIRSLPKILPNVDPVPPPSHAAAKSKSNRNSESHGEEGNGVQEEEEVDYEAVEKERQRRNKRRRRRRQAAMKLLVPNLTDFSISLEQRHYDSRAQGGEILTSFLQHLQQNIMVADKVNAAKEWRQRMKSGEISEAERRAASKAEVPEQIVVKEEETDAGPGKDYAVGRGILDAIQSLFWKTISPHDQDHEKEKEDEILDAQSISLDISEEEEDEEIGRGSPRPTKMEASGIMTTGDGEEEEEELERGPLYLRVWHSVLSLEVTAAASAFVPSSEELYESFSESVHDLKARLGLNFKEREAQEAARKRAEFKARRDRTRAERALHRVTEPSTADFLVRLRRAVYRNVVLVRPLSVSRGSYKQGLYYRVYTHNGRLLIEYDPQYIWMNLDDIGKDLLGQVHREWGHEESEGYHHQGYDCNSGSDFDSDLCSSADEANGGAEGEEDEDDGDDGDDGGEWSSDDDINGAMFLQEEDENADHNDGDGDGDGDGGVSLSQSVSRRNIDKDEESTSTSTTTATATISSSSGQGLDQGLSKSRRGRGGRRHTSGEKGRHYRKGTDRYDDDDDDYVLDGVPDAFAYNRGTGQSSPRFSPRGGAPAVLLATLTPSPRAATLPERLQQQQQQQPSHSPRPLASSSASFGVYSNRPASIIPSSHSHPRDREGYDHASNSGSEGERWEDSEDDEEEGVTAGFV